MLRERRFPLAFYGGAGWFAKWIVRFRVRVRDEFYIEIQRLREFAFFSTNKSDKKDKLSHQSLNITSSSNVIVKILCHTITLFVTPVRINRGSR